MKSQNGKVMSKKANVVPHEIILPGEDYGDLPRSAKLTSIAEYVKTRQSNFVVAGNPLLSVPKCDEVFVLSPIKSDFVIGSIYDRDPLEIEPCDISEDEIGLLMLVNGKPCLALDGDDNRWDTEWDTCGVPSFTISFTCLSQMFNIRSKSPFNEQKLVVKKLVAGDIQIVDFTRDEHRPVSKGILAKLKDKKKFEPKPPEFGFTLLRSHGKARWHRPAWVCLKDREGNFYIMGQDEGSYFCSQLPQTDRKTLTCAEALRLLVPPEANADTPRQGEWFAVKVNEKTIPAIQDCLAFGLEGSYLCLPVESDDSNTHELSGDFRIAKDGSIYASNFEIYHDQHDTLWGKSGWFKLVRNTARRSVSTEGVD